ncbi:MAG TPA: Zn-dependent hydrolase, partial [Bacteroidales bacterium]|nr:Zn-dependent hydrolase [Bacteroidales bacterium]
LYTVLRRNEDNSLKTVWYKDEYKEELTKVNELLDKAIAIAEDPGLKKYLIERKKAFQTDNYFASDMAWMDMKNSKIDFIVGPIEKYDDKLNEAKAAYEAFILIKDIERSKELEKFITMLPMLQKELPCDPKYKTFVPGTSSDLNVYNAVYYAGDCNAGSKTIAINLPNDDKVQAKKGARRLQLRNSMQAKFDKILMPIGQLIIEENQRQHLKFDAFFWNVTFHEVAHGLGVKQTVNNKGTVDDAMKTEGTSWEEAKADILGLFMVCKLIEKGEITNITAEDAITTFIAGILRSVRFGASSSHGKANMMCYNYMEQQKAFTRNGDGTYHIDYEKAKATIDSWANLIIVTQGDGNFEFASKFRQDNGNITEALQKDLDKINAAGIPRDIRFNQGLKVMGLE